MAEVKNEINSETLQATSLLSASLPVPFLLSLLSPLLTLSPPLSPNLILRDDRANSWLLVGCETPPPPSCCPCCNNYVAVPFACVCCAHTYTHTRCPTYSFVACFLAHISAPSISSQSYYLIWLIIIIFLALLCMCLPTHAHNVACTRRCTCASIPCLSMCAFNSCTHTYTRFYPACCRLFTHTFIFIYLRIFIHMYICISTYAHVVTRAFGVWVFTYARTLTHT